VGANMRWDRSPTSPGLPPRRDLIALGEVDGMTPAATYRPPSAHRFAAIPETCPPGEGNGLLTANCS
jgi:hypothetical protein